jgi:hypothetical protein
LWCSFCNTKYCDCDGYGNRITDYAEDAYPEFRETDNAATDDQATGEFGTNDRTRSQPEPVAATSFFGTAFAFPIFVAKAVGRWLSK